jgi:NarL family two-component system response regulator LiaR
MGPRKIRVVVADDHALIRSGLRRLLERVADVEVVGEASDGRQALEVVSEQQPDVVLMDVAMPTMNGVDATSRISVEVPATRVIALSGHSEQRLVRDMLAAGARGYVPKNSTPEELVLAIRRVAEGQSYLSGEAANVLVHDYVLRVRQNEGPLLTMREREVLQLLAEGHNAKAIAKRLGVSIKTVESHRSRIMAKLDLHSVAELTKYAIREGITAL